MSFYWSKWLAGLLLAACMAGCGGGVGQQAEFKSDDNEVAVPVAYRQNCISCHGNELQGRSGPSLKTVGSRLTEEQLAELIQDGKGGMPAYGKRLSEEEISSLAVWLSEKR